MSGVGKSRFPLGDKPTYMGKNFASFLRGSLCGEGDANEIPRKSGGFFLLCTFPIALLYG